MADESKQRLQEAWRVKSAKRTPKAGAPRYEVVIEAIYYGPDEDGPKVGTILVPGEVT